METITSLIIIGVVVTGNVIGWIYSYGKLAERVKNLNGTYREIANNIKDIDGRVNDVSNHVSNLDGTLTTFMDFMKDNHGKKD